MHSPGTIGLILLIGVGFLTAYFSQAATNELVFDTLNAAHRPWTYLTYPFMSGSFIGVLFSAMWLFWIGSSVEADIGTARMIGLWVVTTLLGAVLLQIGAGLERTASMAAGPALGIGALTVAWGTRNPHARVLAFGLVPVFGWVIALVAVGIVFFSERPELAPFLTLPLALVYLYAANRLPFLPYGAGRRKSPKSNAQFNQFREQFERRTKERAERERLRKLFESSVEDDER